jgi:apolipoprotein N-acyltransferase
MQLQLLIAFIAGSCMPLAFAPFSLWPVVILSPAILIFQLGLIHSSRQAFWLGWTYGLGYFGFGVYWLYHSMQVYGHAPVFVAVALTALMIVTLSTFIATTLGLYYRFKTIWPGKVALWSLPLLWFAMEWAKGWVLTGFPWLSVGYAHISSPLAGFAPLVGVYGLSAISIALSLMLAQWKQLKALLIVIVFLLSGAGGFALQQLEWSSESGRALSITMVQGNIPQEVKWQRDARKKIIDLYWGVTQEYWDSDLVVWPEVAIPGRSEDLEADYLMPMSMVASENGSNLLTGIVVSDWLRRQYYNSMLLMGDQQGVYHKRHMVPFGEYMPFRSVLEFMKNYIQIPMSDMTAGPHYQPLMSVKDVKLGVSICYEDVFSRDINLDLPDANILINTSNDAWFGDSLAPHQHLEIAQMRALETARPLVRSTNTGRSAFIDHKGRIVDATDQFKTQTLTETVQGRSGSTPFLYFSAAQPYLAILILLASGLFWLRSHRIQR